MMIKNRMLRLVPKVVLLCGSLLVVAASQAEAPKADKQSAVDPKVKQKIVQSLEQSRTDLKVASVKSSPVPTLYEVQIENGPLVYVTKDGQYFVAGDLYRVAPGKLTNVSMEARNDERTAALANINRDDMIVFSPKGKAKTHITVFTDIDCGYCRMLHQEVPKLNEMGIEVRYLAFPRAGVNSDAYKKLATAWCADNPQETLTKYKSGESVPFDVCKDNPVAEQYRLGQQLGVTATPALVFESGELQLGYMKAPQLAERLGISQ
jgi:thiol:disulfide interchange protein DsbC